MLKEQKTNRKEQIHNAATYLFKEKGYLATSMRDLAKLLEIEAPSLYSHIKSKEEILQKICFDAAEAFFSGLKGLDRDNISAKTRLEAVIHSHILVICSNLDSVAVFLNEWRHLSSPYYEDFLKMRRQYEQEFRKHILYGVENGEFKVRDVDFAVLTILSSLNWTYNWYQPDGKMTPEEIASNLSEILIKGIS